MADVLPPRLLIADTGPLITLAAAESLDYLLIPGIPVIIPDGVYYEATDNSAALGAADIVDWTQANVHAVQVVPTAVFAAHMALLVSGRSGERDLGERAALEVGRYTTLMVEGEACFLLTEDDRVIRGGFITAEDRGRIEVISTHDFLSVLEEAQLINSADAVYERAEDAGRFASRRQSAKDRHDAALAALTAVMQAQASKAMP